MPNQANPASLLSLPAPGKVNLFLHILGQLPNGYHELQTLYQFIDYSDLLTFELNQTNKITLHSPNLKIPMQQNLVFKAANLLRQTTECTQGIHITLKKNIPSGTGLGGGSSDAATTLIAINYLFGTNLSKADLLKLGVQIGADVPIFIEGHAAWGEGIGDQLTQTDPLETWLLLVIPDCQVLSKELYADQNLTRNSPRLTIGALESQDTAAWFPKGLRNDFEPVVRARFVQVAQALDWLSEFGQARLSGSGSCVFASFNTKSAAQNVKEKLPKQFKGLIAKSTNESPLFRAAKRQGMTEFYWGVAKR